MTAEYQYFQHRQEVAPLEILWCELPDGMAWTDWDDWDKWDELGEWIDNNCDGWEWWMPDEEITLVVRAPDGEMRTNTVSKVLSASFYSGSEKPLDGGGQ